MDFSLFLSCYDPDTAKPRENLYGEMLEIAQAAGNRGHGVVTVPFEKSREELADRFAGEVMPGFA